MGILDSAKAEVASTPLIITLLSPPGMGKTMTACTFPKVFLVRTQGESVPRDLAKYGIEAPFSLGITDTEQKLIDQLSALLRDEHDFHTLLIDSVTGLEAMFIEQVVADDPKATNIQMAAGGYGAGRKVVAAKHMRVRKAAEMLRAKRKMNVIFLAHSDINRLDPPDQESFTQYGLRLHKESEAPYIDQTDLVGLIKQPTALIGEDRKRAIGTGDERVLVCTATPAAVTKNRLGITDEIDIELGKNPLAKFLGNRRPAAVPKVKPEAKATEPEPTTEAEEFTADDFVEAFN